MCVCVCVAEGVRGGRLLVGGQKAGRHDAGTASEGGRTGRRSSASAESGGKKSLRDLSEANKILL